MLFELFAKAVMSGGFSLVLEKASYFELSCVTVSSRSGCCLDWLNPVSPNANVFDTWLDKRWNAGWLVYSLLWWIHVIACELIVRDWMQQRLCIYPSCYRWKTVSLCAYLHDLVPNNRVATEKYRQGHWHIWQRNTSNFSVFHSGLRADDHLKQHYLFFFPSIVLYCVILNLRSCS